MYMINHNSPCEMDLSNNLLTENKNKTDILSKSVETGLNGSLTQIGQITTLMWYKTITNYQYVYGTNFTKTCKLLYKQGGLSRFYSGYFTTLGLTPLLRFGDIGINSFINKKFLNQNVFINTGLTSTLSGLWRVSLLPLEVIKTNQNIYGKNCSLILKKRIKKYGIKELYKGSNITFAYSVVSNFGWFGGYNYLSKKFPIENKHNISELLLKSSIHAVGASVSSDLLSNSLRIVKTIKQTEGSNDNYYQINKNIIKKDGFKGLFNRGLKTMIIGNAIQSFFFCVGFNYLIGK